jgi:hypothetical protein
VLGGSGPSGGRLWGTGAGVGVRVARLVRVRSVAGDGGSWAERLRRARGGAAGAWEPERRGAGAGSSGAQAHGAGASCPKCGGPVQCGCERIQAVQGRRRRAGALAAARVAAGARRWASGSWDAAQRKQRGGSGVARAGVEAGDAGARVEQHAASRHWNGASARDPGGARARCWRRWRRRWSRTRASACAGTARLGVQD